MNTTSQLTSVQFHDLIQARLRMQGENAHYLEIVKTEGSTEWINHSIATNVESTWHALSGVEGPVILIIGGVDRGNDHDVLRALVREKVECMICMGSTPWKYQRIFGTDAKRIVSVDGLAEAVDMAEKLRNARTRSILFSPSCPSYDAFDNYRNRGDEFRKLVTGSKEQE